MEVQLHHGRLALSWHLHCHWFPVANNAHPTTLSLTSISTLTSPRINRSTGNSIQNQNNMHSPWLNCIGWVSGPYLLWQAPRNIHKLHLKNVWTDSWYMPHGVGDPLEFIDDMYCLLHTLPDTILPFVGNIRDMLPICQSFCESETNTSKLQMPNTCHRYWLKFLDIGSPDTTHKILHFLVQIWSIWDEMSKKYAWKKEGWNYIFCY